MLGNWSRNKKVRDEILLHQGTNIKNYSQNYFSTLTVAHGLVMMRPDCIKPRIRAKGKGG